MSLHLTLEKAGRAESLFSPRLTDVWLPSFSCCWEFASQLDASSVFLLQTSEFLPFTVGHCSLIPFAALMLLSHFCLLWTLPLSLQAVESESGDGREGACPSRCRDCEVGFFCPVESSAARPLFSNGGGVHLGLTATCLPQRYPMGVVVERGRHRPGLPSVEGMHSQLGTWRIVSLAAVHLRLKQEGTLYVNSAASVGWCLIILKYLTLPFYYPVCPIQMWRVVAGGAEIPLCPFKGCNQNLIFLFHASPPLTLFSFSVIWFIRYFMGSVLD